MLYDETGSFVADSEPALFAWNAKIRGAYGNNHAMKKNDPLYNSRIIQTYLEYLKSNHPKLNIDEILAAAGITREEIADTAHWFSQDQHDRFHDVLVAKTGDEQIPRKAGRYSASSKGVHIFKQYIMGLINVETAFMSMAKLFPLMTRGSTVRSRRLGRSRIEIIAQPKPGVAEKPYQCENRLGILESIPTPFTNSFGTIEHPECFHRGDQHCRYIVSWTLPASLRWRLWRNYAGLIGFFALVVLLPVLAGGHFLLAAGAYVTLVAILGFGYAHRKIRELSNLIEIHQNIADAQIETSNKRYSDSLLVQEIGQATAAILHTDQLMDQLAQLMSHRLDFDRGLIMLADETNSRLVFSAGYGYAGSEKQYLQNVAFSLDKPDSKGIFVRAFLDQKYIITDDINSIEESFSAKSRRFIQDLGVRSVLCVPIVYEQQSLGILAVDNMKSKAPLKKSDVNLLRGIASQIAISIINTRSFQKLQESEDRYRQTLESIEEGYFELGLSRELQFVNKALADLLGYRRNELVSTAFGSYFARDSIHKVEELLEEIERTHAPLSFAHVKMVHKDGRTVPVDLSSSVIMDKDGQSVGFRGMLRNATGRLLLEEERKRLENQLIHAQKMEAIGTLAGGIAHNFNNWLAGILGHVSLLQMDSSENSKVVDRAKKVEQIVTSAAKMTQQLLGYAREGRYEVKPVNLNQIIQDSADTFATARKEQSVHFDLESRLTTVKADRSQIEQVLWNLYINAADAMPDGGDLTITSRTVHSKAVDGFPVELPSGIYAMVSVSDTGSGIDPVHLERLFDPFFTTKKVGKGTGLGLASAYGIIKAHNGFIDAKSKVGAGSTFRILLPAVVANPVSANTANHYMEGGRETILLVDDEEMILDTSRQLLSRLGYNVFAAVNGEDALAIFSKHADEIALVIMDMVMPKMSGGELFDKLKVIKPDVKVILSSGYSLNTAAQKIMDQGCSGFIQKPFDLSRLSTMMRSLLDPACQEDSMSS